jgi:hypothetical protein
LGRTLKEKSMKYLPVLAVFILLFVSRSFAGELFGTISEGDKPVAQGVKVEVAAGDKTYSTETDKFGGYHLYVKEKGKCTLKVSYKDQTPTFSVASFDKSTRYDFVLTQKDGKYILGRK